MPPDRAAVTAIGERDGDAIRRALEQVSTRAAIGHVMLAVGAAVASGTIVFAIWRPEATRIPSVLAAAAACAAGAAVMRVTASRRTVASAARAVEAASAECRNVVITAAELLRHPDRATSRMRARVFRDAETRAAAVPPRRAAPLASPAAALALAIAFAAAASGVPARVISSLAPPRSADSTVARPSVPAALSITARVEPPAYTGLAARELSNPDRIAVVQGSVLTVSVQPAGDWRIRFGAKELEPAPGGAATSVRTVLAESTYLAIEGRSAPAERRLIAIAVTPDRAPVVRIAEPGKDLVYPDARGTVPVAAMASDDFGLQSLELRYTTVSGSGEQFEFQEGTLPLALARETDRAWTGRGQIALSTLELEPGDVVVYRAVARDRRSGEEALASSESYFVEVAAPGQVALEGFALPPERERYALSQQMILLKLERLKAREAALPPARLQEETAGIAAEQRAVRANFIFLMGGTVEDEEVEAEQSHEIQEGRLENTARKEISTAVGHMTRVEQALAAVSTGQAIPPARAAVDALQRAFGRNRYILRMLSARSRIDPSRRLSGELSAAADWQRDRDAASIDPVTRAARRLLSDLLAIAGQISDGRPPEASAIDGLAERALAIDPGADEWQQTAKRLTSLKDAVGRRAPARDLLGILDATLPVVIGRASTGTRAMPAAGVGPPGALAGAWAGSETPPPRAAKEKRQ